MHKFAQRYCWLVKLTKNKELGLYDSQERADFVANLYKTLGYPNAKVVRI